VCVLLAEARHPRQDPHPATRRSPRAEGHRFLTHKGELVVDPFAGAHDALAARDADVTPWFDLQEKYVELSDKRPASEPVNGTLQRAVRADAREIPSTSLRKR
jgi:hypothetical protein